METAASALLKRLSYFFCLLFASAIIVTIKDSFMVAESWASEQFNSQHPGSGLMNNQWSKIIIIRMEWDQYNQNNQNNLMQWITNRNNRMVLFDFIWCVIFFQIPPEIKMFSEMKWHYNLNELFSIVWLLGMNVITNLVTYCISVNRVGL